MSEMPLPPPPPEEGGWPQHRQAAALSAEQRNWGMVAHLSAFVAAFVGLAVLGPLVVWLIRKDEDGFAGHHALEALNFQLTWLVGGFVAGLLTFIIGIVTLGLGLVVLVPLGLLFGVLWIWFTINGALHASRGDAFRYPLTVRLVH